MKKIKTILLSVAIALSLTACVNQNKETLPQNLTPDMNPVTPTGAITVKLNDAEIQTALNNLTTGYETITLTKKGTFELNSTAFESYKNYDNKDGTKTYTFTLKKGLKFSDGAQITAKNYLFTVLTSDNRTELLGFAGYKSGEFNALKGSRLIDDYKFSLTLSKDAIPYYYETSLLSVTPTPIPEGTDVLDSENGAIIKNYLKSEPIVSSGPYILTKSENDTFTLKVNPNFIGNYELQKPTIETITIVNESYNGEVDLLVNELSPSDDESFKTTLHTPLDYNNVFFSCDLRNPKSVYKALDTFAELKNTNKVSEYLLETAEYNLEEYNAKWNSLEHTLKNVKIYDHSSKRIRGYSNISPHWDWTKQILYCFIARE